MNSYQAGYIAGMLKSWGIPPERVDHDAWFRGYNDGKQAGPRPPKTTKASAPGTHKSPQGRMFGR